MTISLEQLKNILVRGGKKSSKHYAAAAGPHYGQVTSWYLGSLGYLIWYRGIDGEGFEICEDEDDLSFWLKFKIPNPLDRILQTANVCGVDELPDADLAVRYFAAYVLVTRQFYGAPTKLMTEFVPMFSSSEPRPFYWISEAQEWIDEEKEKTYSLSEGEICAPTYKIVTV